MKHIHLLILLLLLPMMGQAIEISNAELYFTKVGGRNYISQSNVKAIVQDSYGFMWFGTRNGLNRYDGHTFREFVVDDEVLQCGNHNISALYEDDSCNLWVGTDKGVYMYNPQYESFSFIATPALDGTVMNDWVSSIDGDNDGNIWIIIPNQGVFKYSVAEKTITSYYIPEKIMGSSGSPQCLCICRNGDVWVGSNGHGLYKYDKSRDCFDQLMTDRQGNSLAGENIYALCEYGSGFAIGIHEGKLLKFDLESNVLSDFDTPQIHYKIIRSVACYDGESLYVGTQDGLFIVNEQKGYMWRASEDAMNPYSLSDNNVYSLCQDRDGGLWVGTMFGGVDYLPMQDYAFRKYFPTNRQHSLTSRRLREMCEDKFGRIWIASEDDGVNIYDPTTRMFSKAQGRMCDKHINLALFADDDAVYCGMFKQGMEVFSLSDHSVRTLSGQALNLQDEQSVCAIFRDSKGGYWLGNSWGVYYAAYEGARFVRMSEFGYGFIYDIVEDTRQRVWIATMGSGVWCYDLVEKRISKFVTRAGDDTALSSNSVSSITVDSRGDVWFATDRGGICRYNSERDDFTTFSKKDGLPDDVSYKILEDSLHNLWFGTNKGLVRFNPTTRTIRVFTKEDGLLSNQYNYKSALKASDGTFYFGSIDGLIAFNPHEIELGVNEPPLYITGIQVHNRPLVVQDENAGLDKSVQFCDNVQLDYTQSNVIIEFVALDYVSPVAHMYRYKMNGVDNDWVVTTSTQAAYSQLSPGRYTFVVQCSNNKGEWLDNEASISVVVTPPWWKSIYAYTVYLLLILLIIYIVVSWYQERNRQKTQRAYNLLEIKKEKELYSSKVAFFTSIAHEIKTPLSLIKAPLESVLEMEIEDVHVKKQLQVMEMNTNRLLSLINQLLDFRKIEGNRLNLNYTMQDVRKLIDTTVTRFEPSVMQAGKSIEVVTDMTELVIPIDKEEVTKVLSNLLNNGLKYAAHTIKVKLTTEDDMALISVYTDGDIVPADRRKRIFEPFYQIDDANSGVGLGLSLSRSIVELHKGCLSLDVSDDGKFNVFTCALPCTQTDVIVWKTTDGDMPLSGVEVLEKNANLFDMSGCSVLVVDDNPELLAFLVDRLKDKFIVYQAHDGEEALEVLSKEVIHVVVSDVMMPRMDGFELCRRIKSIPEYNHIPVLLLSAQTDMKSKLYGLEQGADAYIEKPFSFAYLVARVNNLLANRQIERESLMRRPIVRKMGARHSKADEEMMQRIVQEVLKNMHDESFNVEKLAANLNMSRTVLHRKIKFLFDLPPVEYIRIVRLQRAAELLIEGNVSIAEAGAMVGISTPSYFSRLFQKQFGVTPKVFVIQQREKKNQS